MMVYNMKIKDKYMKWAFEQAATPIESFSKIE